MHPQHNRKQASCRFVSLSAGGTLSHTGK